MSYRKEVGKRGEDIASAYLESQGLTVTARNLHVGHDEIDIIAEDDKYILFIEVKARAQTGINRKFGRPASAVDESKRQKLLRAVKEYLRTSAAGKQPRIDVIEVYIPSIREDTPIEPERLIATDIKHIKNAVHN